MVPCNARPVIQPLHRQMNVFIGLEFDHCQPTVPVTVSTSIMARSAAENAGTCEYDSNQCLKRSSTARYFANDQRFEPALRMQPPQRMVARALGMAYFANASHQANEVRDITLTQNSFLCAQSEYHFRNAVE